MKERKRLAREFVEPRFRVTWSLDGRGRVEWRFGVHNPIRQF